MPASGSDGGATSSAFGLLHPAIQRWMWESGWTEMREIQEQAAALILAADRDVILTASTAGGKTEAAFLPILTRVAERPAGSVRVLYLSPLKALINDQYERLSVLGERLEIEVHRWHGDASAAAKRKILEHPAGVLLITPESLEALFVLRGTQLPRILHGLEYTVVDELHAFIGTERGRHLQSLLHRVEVAAGRRVPRVALSATLGEMSLAAEFLRPGGREGVSVLSSTLEGKEVRMLLRGFRKGPPRGDDDPADEDEIAIAEQLFKSLRGSKNLVFANSRRNVEMYADRLRASCEAERLPQEFWPHHGNLAKGLREDAERQLKDPSMPVTVVCTTTLELGIDIGSVKSVAQVGAPPSVASLCQRLGRSGRRNEPAILRFFISEDELTEDASPQDALRLELVQTVAMVRLLLAHWYEPPVVGKLHLSTLIQQVLSIVAERGGVTASRAYETLCRDGPFRNVEPSLFVEVLRAMAACDLIGQTGDGLLVPGLQGERVVNHYSFYSVFLTPEEYRLVAHGQPLGTLPITQPVLADTYLVFGGRRWRVLSVDDRQKVIDLETAPGGKVPRFSGGVGQVHEKVRQEMLAVYRETDRPPYLDSRAAELLEEGRTNFRRFELDRTCFVPWGRETYWFCWTSDRVIATLQGLLAERGLQVTRLGLSLGIADVSPERLAAIVAAITEAGPANVRRLAAQVANKDENKYDRFLTDSLRAVDYAAREFDPEGTMRYLAVLAENEMEG